MRELLVWVDCEMTGLDLGHDALVEVAALVTDADSWSSATASTRDQAKRGGAGADG